MASHNKNGKKPEKDPQDIAIPIQFSTNQQYTQMESPSARRSLVSNVKYKSRLGEPSGSIESTLHKLSANQARLKPENLLSDLSVPFLEGGPMEKEKRKSTPDVSEIYEKVTAQLRARNLRNKTVKWGVQFLIFLLILGLLVLSLTMDRFKGIEFIGFEYWKWFSLLMVIFSGLLITNLMVCFVVFLIEWNFLLKKNVVYFTHGLKSNFKVFIWLGLILCTWVFLFKPEVTQSRKITSIIHFITLTLTSMFIGSFLWLVKTALMKLLASSFHFNRYFERINESIFQHYVLQMLSGRPLVAHKVSKDEIDLGQGSKKEKKKVDWGKLHKMKQEKVPFFTMQMLTDVIYSSGMSTMSDMLNRDVVDGGVELDDDEITSEEEATAMAYKIFYNVIGDEHCGRTYIDENDLLKFMIPEELTLVYPLFDIDEDGHITLKEFCEAVVKIHKDRTRLQHAMNDNKTAVNQLNQIVSAILMVIMLVIWLLETEIVSTKVLVFLSSQLVVAAFIFGNTCKIIFEAIIFVFVTHPFDVGDRCVIDGNVMVVEEMNLLTTVFLKLGEKVYFPNNVLAAKSISNYYRSSNQEDFIEFAIDYRTPLSTIAILKQRIKQYLEQNERVWQQDHSLVVKEIENVHAIKMALFVTHTINFQDSKEIRKRKSQLLLEMKTIFDQLEIKYSLLPQEIHLRNLTI